LLFKGFFNTLVFALFADQSPTGLLSIGDAQQSDSVPGLIQLCFLLD
jgi:hypothetical protein